ncbi:hypothetical protein E4U43_001670 [Claviceps pusilla]|uniref:Aminoglycoside phosphotransferase domain-containing protein n=1 Tax=Claviceps pusilla TaxID=123648 RepID=A0A9P7N9R1_9HYPO|nr:hypothetical protein E4U43_001670 [Claviceps pusilla]
MANKEAKPQQQQQQPPLSQGTDALPINNTRFRRFWTLLAYKTTSRLFYKRNQACIPLSSRYILKTGRTVSLTEAATMEFVASQTKIPVPRVYCSFVRKGQTYIVMERVRGKTFATSWHKLSCSQRDDLFAQLRDMLEELRSLPPPGPMIASFSGGSLCDCRMYGKSPRFGPFPSAREFHHWLREGAHPDQHPDHKDDDEDWLELKKMVDLQDREEWEPPVFTHCDLNPTNIIVRDGNIVSIIDWEMSGWWPSYWEYTSVWLWGRGWLAWQDNVHKFLDPYPDELEMERIRQRWWGEF